MSVNNSSVNMCVCPCVCPCVYVHVCVSLCEYPCLCMFKLSKFEECLMMETLVIWKTLSWTYGKKTVFEDFFFYIVWDTWKKKSFQFWISQKWFEISTPNFHQLFTSIGTRFVPSLKAFGASDLDFPPKTSKPSNGRSGSIFWATPFKFGEN